MRTKALVFREEINDTFWVQYSVSYIIIQIYLNLDKCNSCTYLIKCFLKKIKMLSVLFFLFIR